MTGDLAELFWSKVAIGDGCWEYQAGRGGGGYGYFNDSRTGRQVRAHRFSWELSNGPIPPGMHVCHHCDNPPCVRRDHLFLGTDLDNMRDRKAKGRYRQTCFPKPFCARGHAKTPANTRPNGGCRQCHRLGAHNGRTALRGAAAQVSAIALSASADRPVGVAHPGGRSPGRGQGRSQSAEAG